MLRLKTNPIGPVLTSRGGIHVSLYLNSTQGPAGMAHQLQILLESVENHLAPVLKAKEVRRFLNPMQTLFTERELLHKINSHVGMFRTQNQFRILSLPVEVNPISVVANSFHVKPLLRWLQMESEFSRLVAEADSETHQLPEQLSAKSRAVLFGPDSPLRFRVKEKVERALLEYQSAEELRLGHKNIFAIARAAVEGRIRKLIVADEIRIFGKIDPLTGGLSIHPTDLDHEDDDILDDLAQWVLAGGGEVLVAPMDQIPRRQPALAIMKRRGPSLRRRLVQLNRMGTNNHLTMGA